MSTAAQRAYWRAASLRYYRRMMATEGGRRYLASYKRWRRDHIRRGAWPNKQIASDARV